MKVCIVTLKNKTLLGILKQAHQKNLTLYVKLHVHICLRNGSLDFSRFFKNPVSKRGFE